MFRLKNQKKTIKIAQKKQKIFWKKASKKKKQMTSFVIVGFVIALSTICGVSQVKTVQSWLQDRTSVKDDAAQASVLSGSWGGLLNRFKLSDVHAKEAGVIFSELSASKEYSEITVGTSLIGKHMVRTVKQKPIALVQAREFSRLNKKGDVLESMGKDALDAHPIVSGPWGRKKVEDFSEFERKMIKQAVFLLDVLNLNQFTEDAISEVFFDADRGWVVFFQKPKTTVVFGKKGFNQKARRLSKIFKKMKANTDSLKSIDLDFEKVAIVKFKDENSNEKPKGDRGVNHG